MRSHSDEVAVRLQVGSEVTIRLLKSPRRPDLVYAAECVRDDGDHVVVRAVRSLPTVSIGPVLFETGDMFEEHYWRSRWFGVLQVSFPDGTLKGWYGNISEPIRTRNDEILSRDLELDLWIPANGSPALRLDEDEFQSSGIIDGEPEIARHAREALSELEDIVAKGELTYLLAS